MERACCSASAFSLTNDAHRMPVLKRPSIGAPSAPSDAKPARLKSIISANGIAPVNGAKLRL
jgi:hypothetical protein